MAARQQQRRKFHKRRDIFRDFSDAELIRRYRLDRAGTVAVTDLVRNELHSQTSRNKALPPELKVAITLRYLATGKMQLCSGDDFGVSQPTISRVIWQTIIALIASCVFHQFVKFSLTRQEVQRKQVEFMAIAGFRGVVGVIDGTHVRIVAPKDDEYTYVNRKRYHNINVQVVFDATFMILDIVAKWPGSVHDARILDESGLKMLFDQNYVPQPCHLFGDNGYPFKQWLLTPYTNRQLAGPEANYNR
ncbi:putative nuclease HARBI1 [Portunus trituberculatus]|uniref:putative nuclease HARBI1 n=1 Tax=Portunus trituberculatus TaxID=210409 RepID=UPI001E1CC028|nr:putative nuclease HARBI1 [Portunus trituberculatus]